MREREKIQTYLTEGCGCVKNCSSFYDESYVTKIRSDCAELTNGELDMVVMGQLLALSGRVSRICDKQKKKKLITKKKKKKLPNVGFEPESHRCKFNTLTTRPPKPMDIGSTKM